jgi:DNA-binding NarL/FixJ family response regulator
MTEISKKTEYPSATVAEEPKTKLSIMLLEDDTSCRILLKAHLIKNLAGKYDLSIWESGSLTDFLNNEYAIYCDVLLADLNLPDSNGLQTLKKINKEHPNLPIVVTTGDTDESLGVEAMSCGAQTGIPDKR